jgi:ribosome-associated protein
VTEAITTERLKDQVLAALDDLKAQDVQVLDVHATASFTDAMIIASGTSDRHIKALADRVVEAAKAIGVAPLGIEGETSREWILVDLGDVIVHLMHPQTRAFYNLEKLWAVSEEQALAGRKGQTH